MSTGIKDIGESIGPYRIECVLGQGGMGVVYGARTPDGARVAVKVLLPPRRTGEEFRKRFEREARIRIDHPNVVEVLDTGTDERTSAPWIAFELLEGESLRERLRRGPLHPAEAVGIAVQACRGLDAAHRRGIVHRDLKPGNLFLAADGAVKLLDFGIARWSEVEPELTTDRQVLGTPFYLAPEQARGQGEVDERADLWAIGVLLYETLSGIPPFGRDSAIASMLAVVLDEATPLPAVAPHVPAPLGDIVARCLEKQPDDRWTTAEELRVAFESLDRPSLEDASVPATFRGRPAAKREVTRVESRRGERRSVRTSTGIAVGEKRVVALVIADGVHDIEQVQAAVAEQGGNAVPLLGHRAIGLFGSEAWEGDEVARAARAALQLRGAADRVALASGRATAAGEGVAGDVVLEAERGLQKPMSGVAVVGEAVHALRGDFELQPIGNGLHELHGDGAAAVTGLHLDQDAQMPIFGRDLQLAELDRTLATVVDEERPHVVWASGPPGIGKSRLRRELERRAEARGDVALLVGRAEPLGRESALSLLGTALQSYAKRGAARGAWPSVDGSASLEARQGAVREFVHAVIEDDERAEQCADFLGVLFGVEMPENPETTAAGRDLRLMADRLKLAVHGFFASVAAKQPVALLLEDVQWADQASLDVLQDLVERLSDSPLFVLVTSRSELRDRHPDLFSGLGARVLDLPRLRRPEVGLLCEHLVGHQLPAPVIDAVTERTGGNPLFVEQIVRALDEESLLTSPPSRLPLPLTVEAAVQSRLDHLPPDEKDLCKRAALFGRPFVARELEVLGAQQPTRLLESLRRRELVFSARSHPQAEKQYRFRSSLVGEVAYRMLSDQPRQELHLAAARHLVQREDIDPEEAAIHFERGQQPGQAANGYADAVRVATRQGDSQRVLRCADKALALGPALARVFDLHMARAEAHGFLGQREDQGLALAEALDSADDARKQARVRISQVTWLTRTSRLSDAIEAGEEAIALADQVEDPELCVMARVRHTSALVFSGRFDEADIVMRHARSLTRKVSTHTRAFVAEWEAHLASSRGDMGERHRAFSETVRLFFEAGDVRRAAANESNLADTYNRLGAYEEAEAALRDALDGCRRVGNRPGEGYALLNLAYALGELGRIEDALAALNEAEALPTVHEDTRLSLTVRLYRARVRLPVAPAAELATEAEELSRQAYRDGFPTLRVGALALAARAYLRGEDASRALACSEEALRARDALGSVEEDEAEAFLVHAMALEVVGRSEMARDVVLRGCSRLRYIAARIADPEWRRRFLEDVPAHKALLERE